MSVTKLLVPTYTQMLGSLSSWLKKAETTLPATEAEALLSARLAPDMFPLATQIRFACLQVLESVYRLQGKAFSNVHTELLQEARNAGEQPGTLADAQARIAEALAVLEALAPDALDMDPAAAIVHDLPMGMIFDFNAEQYARDWALSQFYFHLMAAYLILRNQKVALGKGDYVAHMLPFLRPGTMPKA